MSAITHPEGQHAGLLVESKAQVWPFSQHMPLKAEPKDESHGKVLAGHPVRLRNSLAVGAKVSLGIA